MDNATEYMAGINPPTEVERLRESVAHLERALTASQEEVRQLQDELEFLRSTRADDRDRY